MTFPSSPLRPLSAPEPVSTPVSTLSSVRARLGTAGNTGVDAAPGTDSGTTEPVGITSVQSTAPAEQLPVVPVPLPEVVEEVPEPTEIATLPPLPDHAAVEYPRSQHTGEPRRPWILLVAIVACWLSVAATVGAFAWWWYQATTITEFHASARLLTWTHPDPVSALAIAMVILVGLIGLLMAAAAGTAGYNAWAGHRWIRIGGLVCLAVTGLSFLLNWWFTYAMIPLAVGVALFWLPPVRRFFAAMDDMRTVKPVVVPTYGIKYGPQSLIGSRD